VIPSTTAALVGFLFFVAPGLVWELTRERREPPREGSTFREASRVALASVVFTTAGVGIIAIGRAWFGWFVDPSSWLRHGHVYVEHHIGRIALTVGLALALACLLAWLFAGGLSAAVTTPQPRLWRALAQELPHTTRFVSVRVGPVVYTGALAGLDHGPRDDAYIELAQPLSWRTRGGTEQDVEPRFQRVVVPLAEISDVFVEWRTNPPEA
jgi:hypothetical protein